MSEPIWSTGGVGGERAVTDDLEWAVGALRAAADDILRAPNWNSREGERCWRLTPASGTRLR